MRLRIPVVFASTFLGLSALPVVSYAALAKQAGKAGTSSTTSSSPTAKAQANLMDPIAFAPSSVAGSDPIGTPLQITFARLDIDIHYDNLPPTLQADNIIQSISVSPFANTPSDPNFQPDQTAYAFQASTRAEDSALPLYIFSTSSVIPSAITPADVVADHNVVFQGSNDVLLHDIAVELDPSQPAPLPGELNLAEVHIQYFSFDSFGGTNYNDIIATYTTTIDEAQGDDGQPISEIDGVDSFGNQTVFTGDDIISSTSSQTLGGKDVPEPAMLGSIGVMALFAMRRRRNVG
jgi:hypothetical protein